MFGIRALARRVFALEMWKHEADAGIGCLKSVVNGQPSLYLMLQKKWPETILGRLDSLENKAKATEERMGDKYPWTERKLTIEVGPQAKPYVPPMPTTTDGSLGPWWGTPVPLRCATEMSHIQEVSKRYEEAVAIALGKPTFDKPERLTVHEIAERWGVSWLDTVNAVMRQKVGPAPFSGDTWSLISVETAERKLLMPGAVMRFVDEGGLEADDD